MSVQFAVSSPHLRHSACTILIVDILTTESKPLKVDDRAFDWLSSRFGWVVPSLLVHLAQSSEHINKPTAYKGGEGRKSGKKEDAGDDRTKGCLELQSMLEASLCIVYAARRARRRMWTCLFERSSSCSKAKEQCVVIQFKACMQKS